MLSNFFSSTFSTLSVFASILGASSFTVSLSASASGVFGLSSDVFGCSPLLSSGFVLEVMSRIGHFVGSKAVRTC